MRRLVIILLVAILAVTFFASLAGAGGVITKKARYEGENLTILLYNGRECETAKVVIKTSGTTSLAYFSIEVEWDTPSGYHRKKKFPAHPGERYTHEVYICMKGDNPEPGTGVLKVTCGWDEVLYLEYAFDGKYIRFGESYTPPPSGPKVDVDVDVKNEVKVNVPERPRDEKPRETSRSAVFNLNSTPSFADLYVDGNWIGNTPAKIDLPFGQHKIVVKKKGYRDWEKDLNVTMKGEFTLHAELEKMSKDEVAAASRKIFFSSDKKEEGIWKHNIYVMNADGSEVRRLTRSVGDSQPSVSPDGKKIAFASRRDKNNPSRTQIHVMNIDGSNVRKLTNSNEDESNPHWSPDGKKIAFVVTYLGNTEIYVANEDGSGVRRLTNNSDWDVCISWSPDGKKIAFVSGKNPRGGNFDLFVMNADGSSVRRLTKTPFDESYPCWSPDGKEIVFVSNQDGNHEIYMMKSDGSNVRRLTKTPFSEFFPSWSPNGKKIAFLSKRDGNVYDDLHVMNPDGSGVERLTNAGAWMYSWSPDGKEIAFVSKRDGNHEIYVINSDGSNVRRLTNNSGVDLGPCWFPM